MDRLHQELMMYPMPEALPSQFPNARPRPLPAPPEPSDPGDGDDLLNLDVVKAVSLFRRRKLSPVEWLDAYLDRIQRVEPLVRGWVSLDVEHAREEARRAEQWWMRHGSWEEAPLCGVPVGIKDLIFTQRLPTTAGSRLRRYFHAGTDAPAVAALRKAGAIILGKTTTVEFAYGDPPATRNPWNLEHTPGGSSSGSAACIAARMVPLALATQTGGSIIRPSAYCGISGLMPAQDRISRQGLFPMSWTLDHIGPMAISVRDLRYVMPLLSGSAATGQLPQVDDLTIGIPDRYYDRDLDPPVHKAMTEALKVLEGLGARLRPVRLPSSFERAEAIRVIITNAEVAAYHYRDYAGAGSQLGTVLKNNIAAGLEISAVLYQKALQFRRRYMADMRELFNHVDCLAVPSTPTPAPPGLSWTGHRTFVGPSSNADLPSLNVPAGLSETGLPIGLQLIGGHHGEAVILALGEAYQQVTGWHWNYPAV